MLSKPVELHPPKHKQAEFTAKFGLTWPQALAQGVVYNAADAMDVRCSAAAGAGRGGVHGVSSQLEGCEQVLGVQEATLMTMWDAAKSSDECFALGGGRPLPGEQRLFTPLAVSRCFKFGGGFYCARLGAQSQGGGGAIVPNAGDLLAELPKSLYGGFDSLALSNGQAR